MAFIAKPSGGYTITSTQGTNNIIEAYNYLSQFGFTPGAVAGMMGNASAESGLNPWRWQQDSVSLSDPNKGYGLFQYTPAYQYINTCSGLPNYAPNLSTSGTTPGADPNDGMCQLYAFYHDSLGKWDPDCWRDPTWDPLQYPDLYAIRNNILFYYGSGTSLSLDQFKLIPDPYDAAFAFMGCFEKPQVPNYYTRRELALQVYNILLPYIGRDTLLLELKILDTQHKRKFNDI